MNTRFSFKLLCALSFLFLLLTEKGKAQVVVEMKLDTAEILVGQQVQLSTIVNADKNQNVEFPNYKSSEELIKGLEVLRQSKIDTTYLDGNKRVELTRKYTITSFDSALFNIPAMKIVVDADTFQAKSPVGLKVSMIPVDTTKVDQFLGPHTVVPATFLWRNHLLLLSFVTWIILLLLFVISLKLTRRKPLTTKKIIKPLTPPFKEASTALKSINVRPDVNQDEVKNFFIRMTDILRVYLQRRFGVLALEKTTDEILDQMKEETDGKDFEGLKLIFETSDLVKFAKFRPSDFDMERCLTAARNFLENTVDDSMEHPKPEVQIIVLNDGMQRKYRTLLWVVLGILLVGGILYEYFVSSFIYHTFF